MVDVVAALLRRGDRFLICRRPAHKARGLLWEFAGGKVEPGETKEAALARECREELDIEVAAGEVYMELTHVYPDLTVHLTLFNARIVSGEPKLLEHAALAWITPAEIGRYEFCPADEKILARLQTPLPELAKAYVGALFAGNADGHDLQHTLRVHALALRLARAEGANETVAGLAALLHDADDEKLSPQTAGNLSNAAGFLSANGVEEETAARVLQCIREVSFHKGLAPTSPESRCVQDADRLDAIGAVGIARAFAYGGAHGRALYDPNAPRGSGGGVDTVSHFYDKLLLIKDRMQTEAGKSLAENRHAALLRFLEEFYAELDGER